MCVSLLSAFMLGFGVEVIAEWGAFCEGGSVCVFCSAQAQLTFYGIDHVLCLLFCVQ